MSEGHLLSPRGFQAAGVHAGIKSTRKPDLGLLICDRPASAAAVFTDNTVIAAPVKIGREHIKSGKLRGVVVNAGNANACTGRQGEKDALQMCQLAADAASCASREILPSSTGIIGHLMPMDKVQRGIALAAAGLGNTRDHALQFCDAILTTDLRRKTHADSFMLGKKKISLAGTCKGSGMIGPRLSLAGGAPLHATMLAYLTTDAKIAPALLRKLLSQAAEISFNAVTVDDHTSTNDTAAILASGASEAAIDSPRAIRSFTSLLNEACQSLAYQIAADGEGATKVVRIEITGARTDADAKAIARSIANSPLVKCAMNGNDPNWGRIVSAAGYCGAAFNPDRAILKLQGTIVFKAGQPVPFDAIKASRSLKSPEVVAELSCGLGKSSATCWTCDLSKEYVSINADYHT